MPLAAPVAFVAEPVVQPLPAVPESNDARLGASVKAPLERPRDGGIGEMNVAAKDFDLSGFEVGASIPFKLTSMPAFGVRQEGDLMFEVWGRIEILAPR